MVMTQQTNINTGFYVSELSKRVLLSSLVALFSILSLVSGCHAEESTHSYAKNGLSFHYPATWKINDDFLLPGTRRALSVETPTPSIIRIEMYAKDTLLYTPEYRQYDTSLKQFAKRYNKLDVGAKLTKPEPITQKYVERGHWKGLRETQPYNIGTYVNETLVREFYRMDTKNEIVFITMDTSKDEYKSTSAGFDTILKSFKYQ